MERYLQGKRTESEFWIEKTTVSFESVVFCTNGEAFYLGPRFKTRFMERR